MYDHDPVSPVLVVAAPGIPGATLAAALGRNPAACDLPELNLELSQMLDSLLREAQGLAAVRLHGLLRALAQLLAGEQSMDAVDMARRWLMRRIHLPTATVAREIAAVLAPRRMIRPVSAALFDPGAMERLPATFPQADIVVVQMHPRHHGARVMAQAGGAAAILYGARDDSVTPPVTDPQMLWLMAETALDGLRATIPPARLHAVQVEALARDPAATLAGLARALRLEDSPDSVARMCHPEASPFAGPGPFGAHLAGDILGIAELRCAVLQLQMAHSREAALEASLASLAGPLPWRADAAPLCAEVRARAQAMGYS